MADYTGVNRPKRTLVILMDSLNRHFLPAYGNQEVQTPNIDRLASVSCVFDRHYVGSAPCMPARHDLLTGRLDFLERNWAPIQPFDVTLPDVLKKNGIFSHLVTDHYHYYHLGGENYPYVFGSWDFIRGQEHDTLVSDLGPFQIREHYGNNSRQYERNRATFHSEADYPSPRTLQHAADWIDQHHEQDWFLLVDSFDPHEPFDVPDEDPDLMSDGYTDKLFYWPPYGDSGVVPENALAHARKRYEATLKMSDRWLGRVLDVLDKHQLWEDTLVILTTDHGFMLGEKQLLGKNYMPAYNEVYQIPLMVHVPGQTSQTRANALTQNIDLFPTILEHLGIDSKHLRNPIHGQSLLPLLRGEDTPWRDAVIYGMFGRQVNLCDGRYTYFRSAVRPDNTPLSVYTAMPSTINHYWDPEHLSDIRLIEAGRFLSWTDYPVFKIPNTITQLSDFSHDFKQRDEIVAHNLLYDLESDPGQEHPLADLDLEQAVCRKLRQVMIAHDSPPEQFERLGI